MFEIELLELLNKYKRTSEEYEQKQIQNSLCQLILQNKDEYTKFMNNQVLESDVKQLLKQCEKQNYEQELNKNDTQSDANTDINNIKNFYKQWLSYYENNNRQVNQNCEQVIEQIINFYMLNRYEILEKILTIEDTQDYEAFKNHIKNKIRLYYLNKIKEYMQCENYEKMFFIKKLRKKNEISSLLDELQQYKFNKQRINEVLQ